MLIEEVPTPALLVERRRLVENLERMQARATANHVALRPHIKTHKSVAIARHQRGVGAKTGCYAEHDGFLRAFAEAVIAKGERKMMDAGVDVASVRERAV